MSFSVTVLGSGAATPTSTRNPSGMLVKMENHYFLVDCGEGTQMQINRFNLKGQRINHIFISHLHGDHFFGLIGLISTFHLLGRKETLHIYSDPALREIIELQLRHTQTILVYPIDFHPFTTAPETLFEDENMIVSTIPLEHRITATGFLFAEKQKPRKIRKELVKSEAITVHEIKEIKAGKDFISKTGKVYPNQQITFSPAPARSFAYCSDTRFSEEIIKHIQGVTLLYHEASFMEDKADAAREKYHSTARQAATVALKSNAGKLLIGHFSARYKDLSEMLKEATEVFENTILAEDGITLCI